MRRLRIALLIVSLGAALVVAGAAAFGVIDEPLADGVVGQPYSYQVKVSGGQSPYEFTIKSGVLPPGLGMSISGLISGTPTQAGGWSFYIEGSYYSTGQGRRLYSQRSFKLGIKEGIAIQTASLPGGTLGSPYSATLTATGGGAQTWSVSAGALPPGLALATNGVLSGTPTTIGAFSFTAKVTDGSRIATRAYSVNVIEALALTASEAPPAVVGSPFTLPLQASGGQQPYVWSIKSGTWPKGLSFTNGVISGTPKVAGSFAFSIGLTDSLGNAVELPLTIDVQPRLKIPLQLLKPGVVGRAYRFKILTKGGAVPYTFDIASGDLPPGIRLNASTGVLSGKPRLKGRYAFAIVVADQLGGTHQRSFVLRVR